MEEAAEKNHSDVEQPVLTLQEFSERVHRHWRQYGGVRTARFLLGRVWRKWEGAVYEARLDSPRPPAVWEDGEYLQSIGPDNIDSDVTPDLAAFLGSEAVENLDGVRKGNRLFVVSGEAGFLHCGYILFRTRQTRILGEQGQPPLIGGCYTAGPARGRGLYRKALLAELSFLREQGYQRAVIETHPKNTASRKGVEAAGFEFCRNVSAWILLNSVVLQKTVDSKAVQWRILRV